MANKARQRELARLRDRREQERRRQRRRRNLLWGGIAAAGAVVVAGGVALAVSLGSSAASGSTTTPGLTARIDAPSAPATVACGGKVPPYVYHPKYSIAPTSKAIPTDTYRVTFQTSCGNFTVQLDPKRTPYTTYNFVFLAMRHFYDSTWFHRIVHGSARQLGVIQGGDPEGNGKGGPGYTIADEFPTWKNPYGAYTIAMANTGQAHSGGSQFFINTQNNSKLLAPVYTVFGRVVSGFDVVNRIAAVPTGGAGGETPLQAVWIDHATVSIT